MNSGIFQFGFFILATNLFLSSAGSADNVTGVDQEAWLSSVHESWAEEDSEFRNSSTSPLAGTQRFTISEANAVHFSRTDGELAWVPEPSGQAIFSLFLGSEEWQWTGLENEIALTREDKEIPSGSVLAAGDTLKTGRLTVQFYPSTDRITVLVFDSTTRRRSEFKTLDRFEANVKFAVTARIVRFETPEQLELITARQEFKKQYRYARLHFEIDGMPLELTAYKHALEGGGSNMLFIPFTDKTSGKLTYGGGRYLFADEPEEGNEVQIDFNRVINPLCSYATIYNCIVPTLENKLPIEILAGVKKYH